MEFEIEVKEKPNYLVSIMQPAIAKSYMVRGSVKKIILNGEFIGYGVMKDGELL
jgi:hypothetical protein